MHLFYKYSTYWVVYYKVQYKYSSSESTYFNDKLA